MERHIEIFLNRLSYVTILIGTVTFVFLLKTPDTCVSPSSSPKPHLRFPKSSCDVSSHQVLTTALISISTISGALFDSDPPPIHPFFPHPPYFTATSPESH
ncbi:hypothetical protein ACFX1T_043600 [Malus domestica]